MNTKHTSPATTSQQSANRNETDIVQDHQQITCKITGMFFHPLRKTSPRSSPLLQLLSVFAALAITAMSGVAHAACAPSSVVISTLPYMISNSSTSYCLTSNLSFTGNAGQPAIIISSGVNNDIINFNGFSLTLANSQEVGIQMEGTTASNVSNIVIENGTIQSAAPATTALNVAVALMDPTNITNPAFNNVTIQNMNFVNIRRDLQGGIGSVGNMNNGVNLQVNNSHFSYTGIGIVENIINGLSVTNSSFTYGLAPAQGGTAISADAGTNVLVQNDTFTSTETGVSIATGGSTSYGIGVPSSNLVVTKSTFTGGSFADINLRGMSNVQITYDTFNDVNGNLGTIGFSSDTNLGGNVASGLLIDHVTVNNTSETTFPHADYQATRMIQLGSEFGIPGRPIVGADNVVISNSTFTQTNGNQIVPGILGIGLLAFGVDGLLVENNTFSENANALVSNSCSPVLPYTTSAPNTVPDSSANIHLGTSWGDVNVQNVLIIGNNITGAAQIGIYSQTGALATPNQNIDIIGNNITGAEQGILFQNTIKSLVAGNYISQVNGDSCFPNGTGIQLDGSLPPYNLSAASSNNSLLLNVVTKNQIGINIMSGALNNLLFANSVFGNALYQVINGN